MSKDNNLESFCFVWLVDDNTDTLKTKADTEKQFGRCLKTFEDENGCEQYIQNTPTNNRIVLIVNDHLGQKIVPHIHRLEQVSAIYVYGTNNDLEEKWTKKYSKVKGVVKELDTLLEQIKANYNRQSPNRIDKSAVFNVFNMGSSPEQSTTGLNGQFISSQLLVDCLLRIRPTEIDRNELIDLAKKEYEDSKYRMNIVNEFEKNYSPDRALWWYTRESFLYQQLNKALRMQNIDSMFIFRFFIRDIEKQLKRHQCTTSICVFRGQLMSNEEMELLKESIGQLISMNSFLSTTVDRQMALSFLYSSTTSDHMQRVLFQIDADPQLDGIRPFADITSLSYFPGEIEVLFMLGSIFRLVSVDCDDHGIWIFRLTLCSNNDHNLQAAFDYMKNQHGSGETTLLSVGLLLCEMGKYDEAEKYFRRLLKEIPSDHEDIAACYHNLGNLFDHTGDYESSLNWHQKALETMVQTLNPNDPNIGTSYNSIAAVHAKMGAYQEALEAYIKAFEIWGEAYGEDHPNIALCLSNMAGIYVMYEKFSIALEYLQKALAIYQEHLPASHPQLGDIQNNIGTVYLCLENFDLAFEHLNTALKIKLACLPDQFLIRKLLEGANVEDMSM
jgi:tetratricopeptide (TPR) repeat protein